MRKEPKQTVENITMTADEMAELATTGSVIDHEAGMRVSLEEYEYIRLAKLIRDHNGLLEPDFDTKEDIVLPDGLELDEDGNLRVEMEMLQKHG